MKGREHESFHDALLSLGFSKTRSSHGITKYVSDSGRVLCEVYDGSVGPWAWLAIPINGGGHHSIRVYSAQEIREAVLSRST